jgi:hypothetical protein
MFEVRLLTQAAYFVEFNRYPGGTNKIKTYPSVKVNPKGKYPQRALHPIFGPSEGPARTGPRGFVG